MTAPLITIGIPVFNSARFLRQSIESALAQDWPAKEVLVVDDGSTDESPEIMRSFGEAIRVLVVPHGGQAAARNAIAAHARGDWLQFLDADDYLLPPKLSQQLAEAGDLGAIDFLMGPVWFEDYEAHGRRRMVPEPGQEKLSPCQQILTYQIAQTAGFLWRKTALQQIGGWNEGERRIDDWELYMRALRHGLRWKFTPSVNVVYRLRWGGQQVSMGRRATQLAGNLELFLNMAEWMAQRGEWTAREARACGPPCFQMLRALAAEDLPAAQSLHRRLAPWRLWTRRGLRALRCTPPSYAAVYRWLGFGVAENLARILKSPRA